MQHINSRIQKLYPLISSSVTVTSSKDHNKMLQARTRDKSSNELCFEDKACLRGKQSNINKIYNIKL